MSAQHRHGLPGGTVRNARPRLLLLLAIPVLAWSFNYVAGKWAVQGFQGATSRPAFTVAILRVLIATALLVLLALLRRTRRATRYSRPLSWRDHWLLFALGFTGVTLNQCFFVTGLAATSVSHSSLIIALTPVLVLLLAAAWGQERLRWREALGMLLSFAGVAVLVLHAREGESSVHGDLIVFLAAAAFAVYTVLGKDHTHRYAAFDLNLYTFLWGSLPLLPFAWLECRHLAWKSVSFQGWAGLLFMAAVGSVLAYLAYFAALKILPASELSSLTYLQPVLATLFGIALLHEHAGLPLLGAAVLIFAGVSLTTGGSGSRPAEGNA